ncbi:MAG: Ig-like domain-containing protein, partial [Planctomycetia bacterium]|nr:Ig-like domain-containing protein [Planctomycetia bacterium]
ELVVGLDDLCSGLREIVYTVVNTGETSSVESAPITIRVNVVKYNRVPKAYSQTLSVEEDGSITIQLQGTNGEKARRHFVQDIEYQILSGPRYGTLEAIDAEAGTYRYTPTQSFSGYDYIYFRVRDDGFDGLTAQLYSGVKYVRISLTEAQTETDNVTDDTTGDATDDSSTNQVPVAHDVSTTVAQGSSGLISLSGSDADEDATLTYTITRQPEHGTMTAIDGASSTWLYTADADFTGEDVILYKVTDEFDAESDEATVTVTVSATESSAEPEV